MENEIVKNILIIVLELDPNISMEEVDSDNIALWDSMRMLSIVAALENEFGLFIDASDAVNLTSYNNIIKFLENHPEME